MMNDKLQEEDWNCVDVEYNAKDQEEEEEDCNLYN